MRVVASRGTRHLARRAALAAIAGVLSTSSALRANETGAVVLTSTSGVDLRVQLSEGTTSPCDSGNNRMLLDGRLPPGATFRAAIAGDCVCIRSTTPSFPNSDWSVSGLKCRPRVCSSSGRVCRPAPDPTIYLSVP